MASGERRKKHKVVTWEMVRDIALALPDAVESTSYETPAIKVRGKLFVRLREERDSIVIRIDLFDRAKRLQANPDAFFVTDQYVPYPYMLVRLPALKEEDLAELLREAWWIVAQ